MQILCAKQSVSIPAFPVRTQSWVHRENEKLALQWVDIANTAQARGQDQHTHSWNALMKESPTVWDCPESTTTASPQDKQQARFLQSASLSSAAQTSIKAIQSKVQETGRASRMLRAWKQITVM